MIDATPPRRLDAPFLESASLRRLLAVLNPPSGAGETRIVGGAVRNALLGLPVQEIDCATVLTPEIVTERATRAGFTVVPTGVKFGTVTVVVDGHAYEVTTLRRDVATDGRWAEVVFGTDWAVDAARRDLTVNALYCDPDGTLHDPLGGLDDVLHHRVRFIGDPEQRIREDHLRALRFYRFHAQYGEGALDEAGFRTTIRLRAGLARLSRERIRQELLKLLVARRAVPTIETLAETGILSDLVGVPDLGSFARLVAVEAVAGIAPAPVRRLAALAVRLGEDAARLAADLRLSRAEEAVLEACARFSPGFVGDHGRRAARRIRHAAGEHYENVCLVAWARSRAEPHEPSWDAALRVPETAPLPPFPLRGADIVARGVPPGPAVGEAMARAEAAWIASDFTLDRDELLARVGRER
jgi:tRNA nucleotidyltransferase/poly(A) polymerase